VKGRLTVPFSRRDITESLRLFVRRRDALLHEDAATFEHYLERFVGFCRDDPLVQSIIGPLQASIDIDLEAWWQEALEERPQFPQTLDADLLLRYEMLCFVVGGRQRIAAFGMTMGKYKWAEAVEVFRSVVIHPFVEELGDRLGDAADLASPQARDLQAVPLHRIPSANETRVFLSHRSVDKELVYRYYRALEELGFAPWMDEPDMPAGANLEREILRGFTQSCAAVFFVTESFVDEAYLATEVDYATQQKREKGKKFAIVTLRYSGAAAIPELLTRFVYKDVENDLEGFYEVVRALPIELGPVRWKAEVVQH